MSHRRPGTGVPAGGTRTGPVPVGQGEAEVQARSVDARSAVVAEFTESDNVVRIDYR